MSKAVCPKTFHIRKGEAQAYCMEWKQFMSTELNHHGEAQKLFPLDFFEFFFALFLKEHEEELGSKRRKERYLVGDIEVKESGEKAFIRQATEGKDEFTFHYTLLPLHSTEQGTICNVVIEK